MSTQILRPTRGLPILSALILACGGEREAETARPTCPPAADAAIRPAVLDYIRSATPAPQRYLVAAGTDSALPEAGQQALKSKGPMFLYPADAALQEQVRGHLAAGGPWPTLLVTFRGVHDATDSSAVVRLGGTFVGGADDGKQVAARDVQVACSDSGWTVRPTGGAPAS